VAKKWQRGHILGFFGPFGGENLVQIFSLFLGLHFFHADSRYVRHFARGCLHQKCNASGATHLLEKLVFQISKFKNDKNFLKFGMTNPC